jgi:hypothetical protein
MFREMRRFKQQLEDQEALDVLRRGHRGVLSLIGDDGYPYGVPINYFLGDDCHIYALRASRTQDRCAEKMR